jgi:hypothetical protein
MVGRFWKKNRAFACILSAFEAVDRAEIGLIATAKI